MCFARTCTRHTVNRLGSVALATLLCILSWVLRSPAFAQEKELAAGHPVRLEDAFYVPAGEGSMLATAGLILPNRGARHGLLALDLQYGLLPRTQMRLWAVPPSDP